MLCPSTEAGRAPMLCACGSTQTDYVQSRPYLPVSTVDRTGRRSNDSSGYSRQTRGGVKPRGAWGGRGTAAGKSARRDGMERAGEYCLLCVHCCRTCIRYAAARGAPPPVGPMSLPRSVRVAVHCSYGTADTRILELFGIKAQHHETAGTRGRDLMCRKRTHKPHA